MYKIEITYEADKQLSELETYYLETLENPNFIFRLFTELQHFYDLLSENPYLCPFSRNNKLKRLGYRKGIVKKYIILYTVDESNEIIYIEGIHHGKKDYESLY